MIQIPFAFLLEFDFHFHIPNYPHFLGNKNKIYHIYQINEEQAIKNILLKRGIQEENITINQADTFSSVGYYSTANYETGNEAAFGKFLVGAYYEDTFPDYDGSYNTRKL